MEPITALTDAILAAWTASLCALLFVRAKILWACGFAAAALSSLAGAAYHAWRFPWKLVPIATGAAALCFGAAAAVAWLGPRARRIAIAILIVEFAACVVAASMSDNFLVVAADYLPVLAAILVGCAAHWRERAARLLALGIVVSFVAAGVQMSALPAHNDVFHVIQMAAMFLLYRGAPGETPPRTGRWR